MEGDEKIGHMENKIDDLTGTVNRLSKNFDAYVTETKRASSMGLQPYSPEMAVAKEEEDEFATDFSKDENEDRGNWSGQLDFLLACLGYAVGLGNVWRFPYLCYKNGGAVFFIPYVIMLFFVGIPIFLLELSLGQFTSSSPLTCWECVPIAKGVGVAMVLVSGMVGIYYNMIIAWSLFYFFASFTSHVPWQDCDNDFNTQFCARNLNPAENCTDMGMTAFDTGLCFNETKLYGFWNETLANENGFKKVLASEEYLNRYVLGKDYSEGLQDLGPIRWQLVLCLIGAWVIVFAALVNGVKSSGKVVYFTALFPYAVLVILLIRGVTLDGHFEGIKFYILQPDLGRLKDAQVWKDAAVQIFFSLSASWGGLIALASYNRFHNDCLRDTLIVSLGNCLTSFFAGFVIFSFLGFLAKELNVGVEDVAESGVGLAFIVYPDAVTRMPVSTIWALLFFLMLITLGLDSEFALVETVTTSILDQWPQTRKRKWLVVLLTCIAGFLLGLVMCTNGGAYMLQLIDTYAGGWNVLFISLCECITIAYVYGFCRFKEDIRIMIGNTPCCCTPWTACSYWWGACWYCFTPLGVLFILIFSWYDYSPANYGEYLYPTWGDALGWLMTMFVVLGIIVTAFASFIYYVLYKKEKISYLFKPTRYWGPALPKHRRLMANYLPEDEFEVDPWADDRPVELNDVKFDGGSDNPTFNEKF